MHEEKFMEIIKQAALRAVEAQKPVNVVYGKIVSISPLTVRINQKEMLSGDLLDVCAKVLEPPAAGAALKSGDKVILLRMQGGQKYVLLDKVVS